MYKQNKQNINTLISLLYSYKQKEYTKQQIYELLRYRYSYPTISKYYNQIVVNVDVKEIEDKLNKIKQAIE